MAKVFVNIYNKGKILGIKLPVYNYPMEESVVDILKELNFNIEVVKNPKKVVVAKTVAQNTKTAPVKKIVIEKPTTPTTDNSVEEWMTKKVYTEDELKQMTKLQLSKILNYRGHYSAKTGMRDPLAPKFEDTKVILIEKVLKTNKV